MRKKTYISPVCHVVNISHVTLLSGSPNIDVPYDSGTNTGDALSPFLQTDKFNDIENLLNL